MSRPIFGIVVGTALASVGFWLALLYLGSNVPIGLFVIGVSVSMSMLAVAGFGRQTDPLATGIRAAIFGLLGGSLLFVLSAVTGSGTITLLLPAVTLGVGGVIAHPGDKDPHRLSMRLIVSGAAAILVVIGGLVTIIVWVLLAPILPLPSLVAADWLTDRSKD
ncbi:MAG: hypothetical protein U9R51_02225 [Actinomycetota bacterium]|nr:hypothetical protein [Actinomycetota bacterium]